MLDKKFAPQEIESTIYPIWEESGHFSANPHGDKKPYTIMMPPPNVTGSLHVGHALTYTLQDILIRFKRMCGYDVLWQPGTDHAGIATQIVVEKQLAAQGVSRQDLGRAAFIDKVWEWKAESGEMIVHQQRRLGISPDWSRQRFTMDEGLSQAVAKVFVDLFNQGLIYRDKRLVNWDPKMQTAISDLEVVAQDMKGHLWYIAYPVVGQNETITVATTRPETLFGDTAVAVHPDDPRYQHLIGKFVRIPLTDRTIPIIADAYCDPEKGSGAVKITPGHDFNDFDVGKRHALPMMNILDAHACLNEAVPVAYQGLKYDVARQKVLTDLEDAGHLVKADPIQHTVPYGERSGVEVQPWMTDQWFVDAHTLAQPAIRAVEDKKTQFFPEFWTATYFEWLRNIQPWCISRQIWWGHQIPAWYGPDDKPFVALTEVEAHALAHEHYGHPVELRRDMDVLDTWFSSALWPFSTLGWPEKTPEFSRYYPGDVLDTGFDIIFFWVARMMMMGLHFTGDVPFRTVYIHALVRDEKGAKMSKSKGNIINPLDSLNKYGCDAVRFTLSTLAVPGRDVRLGESRIESSRNFMTKLWNAARYLQMNQCTYQSSFDPMTVQQTVNKWIIHECATLAHEVYQSLETYRFDEAASKIYQFAWGTYCDYYLEFLKPLFADGVDEKLQQEARQTAAWVFVELLRILHPISPFITESLWAEFVGDGTVGSDLLMGQNWPVYGRATIHPDFCHPLARAEMNWVVDLITQVRSRRAEFNIPPALQIPLHLYDVDAEIAHIIERHRLILIRLGRLSELDHHATSPEIVKGAVQFMVGHVTAVLPLADAIDVDAEIARLQGEYEKLNADIMAAQKKLGNPEFMAKAKPEIIDEVQLRVTNAMAQQQKIQLALKRLGN